MVYLKLRSFGVSAQVLSGQSKGCISEQVGEEASEQAALLQSQEEELGIQKT